MVITGSDSDDFASEGEDQDVVKLCLMAQVEEVIPKLSSNFIFEELQDVFHGLIDELRKMSIKNKDLKNKNTLLTKEKEEALPNNKILLEENQVLKNEVKRLKPLVDKFICSSKKIISDLK